MKLEADRLARTAAEWIRAARHAVAFTGAGISTPSGIPDFRTAGSGLWSNSDPMKVASLSAFRQRPQDFFDWLRPLAASMAAARPNPAHIALAQLEAAGLIQAVITQNIDPLHRAAGTGNLLELHGSMETLTCPNCRQTLASADFLTAFIEANVTPRCPECGSLLKPDIVLYEEMLPARVWRAAEQHSRAADLMLVVGSSLEVSPANMLPEMVVESGGRLIINTRSSTFLDDDAALLLPYDAAEILPIIAAAAMLPASPAAG